MRRINLTTDLTTDKTSRVRTYGRSGVLALAVALASCLAACGGSSGSEVASLGTSTSSVGNSAAPAGSGQTGTTRGSGGNATKLLDEWATCMRSHGDANQADPTVDANKVIHITLAADVPGGYDGTSHGGQGNVGPGQYCRTYLSAAQTALRGAQQIPNYTEVQLVRVAECMRANGIPDFPDPSNGNLSFNRATAGSDLNPNNPRLQNAAKKCAEKTGVRLPGVAPLTGAIVLNGAGGGGDG